MTTLTVNSSPPVELVVLYADDALLAVNKPAGLRTLPDGYRPDLPHLRSFLEPHWGRLWIVHRLDKDTSGVVVLARTAQAHRALNDAFARGEAAKVYHALIVGEPEWEERSVDLPLLPDGDRRHRTVVDEKRGKPSVTCLRVLERLKGYTLIEAVPKTGRTHQIRAHLAAVGLPLASDPLYGRKPVPAGSWSAQPPLPRLGLHAWAIAIAHPVTGQRMQLEAPYGEDFDAALRQLRHERG